MIRQITKHDLPKLMECCAEAFFKEGNLPGKFSPFHFLKTWEQLLDSKMGFIFGIEVNDGGFAGAIGGNIYPDICTGEKVCSEMFWYTLPGFRGKGIKLLHKLEQHAKENGCSRVLMVHLAALNAERLEQYYQRCGYSLLEKTYMKEI